jgi:hypothetical protein
MYVTQYNIKSYTNTCTSKAIFSVQSLNENFYNITRKMVYMTVCYHNYKITVYSWPCQLDYNL